MWGLGVFVGFLLVRWFFKKEGKPVDKAYTLTQYIFFWSLIGARLGMLFYEPEYFFRNPMSIFHIWDGGLASHGCILGTLAALWLFQYNNKEFSFWWLLDRSSIIVLPLAGLVRIGNLFNHEIIGKATEQAWGFIFTRSSSFITNPEMARHPSQLYDAILVFLLFGIFMLLYHSKMRKPDGFFFSLYFIFAFGFRALLEFWKYDSYTTQLLSLPVIFIGFVVLIFKVLPAYRQSNQTIR